MERDHVWVGAAAWRASPKLAHLIQFWKLLNWQIQLFTPSSST